MIFELVTTRDCNLNCNYCFEGKKNNMLMPDTSIKQIISFIESTKNRDFIYDKDEIRVDFNGGEALLNKSFLKKFIEQSENLKYTYSITTNGTLIDQEIIDLINKYNINIQISLDGQKETHNHNRKFSNGEGSFDIVLSKLKQLQEKCQNTNISIACVVTPETVHCFSDNVAFLVENGFYDISTAPCSDYKWSMEDYEEYKKQIHSIGELYIKSIEENNYFSFNPFRRKIENTLRGLKKGKCDAIKGQLAILPDGNILPCGVFIGCENEENFYIGNIKDDFDIGKVNSFFKKYSVIDYSVCEKCSIFGRCKNDCLALNNRVNKEMLKCDIVTCNINQIVIFEVDRILEYFVANRNKYFYKYFKQYLPQDYLI